MPTYRVAANLYAIQTFRGARATGGAANTAGTSYGVHTVAHRTSLSRRLAYSRPVAVFMLVAGFFVLEMGGVLTPAAAIQQQVNKALVGTLTPASTLIKLVAKIISGSIIPASTLIKLVAKIISGSITPVGTFTKALALLFSGSITPTGAFTKAFALLFSGTITPTSSLVKLVKKIFQGSAPGSRWDDFGWDAAAWDSGTAVLGNALGAIGSLVKQPSKMSSGSTTLSGNLGKMGLRNFVGSITGIGTLLAGGLVVLVQYTKTRLGFTETTVEYQKKYSENSTGVTTEYKK